MFGYISVYLRMDARSRDIEVHTLSQPDAAYIAGLIDGEGTITLTRKYRGGNRQLAVTKGAPSKFSCILIALSDPLID